MSSAWSAVVSDAYVAGTRDRLDGFAFFSSERLPSATTSRASSSFANTALTRPERISASISAPNTRTISKDARANATLQFASAAAAAAAATSPSP